MSQLSVTIDKKSGFCFGVVFAIQMAEDMLDQEGKLYCLGDIVHNDEEVKRLAKKGLRVINHTQLKTLKNEKVLFRAHGEPPSTYEIAFANNIHLLDASCPVVLKLQQAVRESQSKQEKIYLYGQRGHPEVLALLGQLGGNAQVFQSVQELDMRAMPRQITLYSQTTKSVTGFYNVVKALREMDIDVHVRDTVCRQVSNRERDMQRFATAYDSVIFVSGRHSSNGKALYKICKNINPSTHFIAHEYELRSQWFSAGDKVGICGATSTPQWLMEKVRDTILAFTLCG